MQTETKLPPVPEDQKPEACRRLRCAFRFRRPGVVYPGGNLFFMTGDDTGVGGFLIHGVGPSAAAYAIPLAWLDDVDKDIWGEIRPWMDGLHGPAAR